MREIFKLPYPSTLVGSSPLPSSYLVLTTFKRNHRNHRNHDRFSYYLKFSAIPLREHVKFLSRHTRWVAGSTALSAYRFLHGRRCMVAVGCCKYVSGLRRVGRRLTDGCSDQAGTRRCRGVSQAFSGSQARLDRSKAAGLC